MNSVYEGRNQATRALDLERQQVRAIVDGSDEQAAILDQRLLQRDAEARHVGRQVTRAVLGRDDVDENLERERGALVKVLGSELNRLEQPLPKDVEDRVAVGRQVAHFALLVRDADLEVLVDEHLDAVHESQEDGRVGDGLVRVAQDIYTDTWRKR